MNFILLFLMLSGVHGADSSIVEATNMDDREVAQMLTEVSDLEGSKNQKLIKAIARENGKKTQKIIKKMDREEAVKLQKVTIAAWSDRSTQAAANGNKMISAKEEKWQQTQAALLPHKDRILTTLHTSLEETKDPLPFSKFMSHGWHLLGVVQDANIDAYLKGTGIVLEDNLNGFNRFSKRDGFSADDPDSPSVKRVQQTLRQLFFTLESLCEGAKDKFNKRLDDFFNLYIKCCRDQ